MANKSYWWPTAFTGGAAGVALDSIDGTGLVDGDYAIVTIGAVHYLYRLAASSGATEATPEIISPDTNAGNKRWVLQNGNGKMKVGSFTATSSASPIEAVTGVGFQPAVVLFFYAYSTSVWSVGIDDSTAHCAVGISGGSAINSGDYSIIHRNSYINSMDSDGFTIRRVSSSSLAPTVYYLAIS